MRLLVDGSSLFEIVHSRISTSCSCTSGNRGRSVWMPCRIPVQLYPHISYQVPLAGTDLKLALGTGTRVVPGLRRTLAWEKQPPPEPESYNFNSTRGSTSNLRKPTAPGNRLSSHGTTVKWRAHGTEKR
eukprot:2202336-Rhodomonas_salina.2